MRHPVFSTVVVILAVSAAQSAEEPQAIITRAANALGGEANLSRAGAMQAKIKGTLYDPGVHLPLIISSPIPWGESNIWKLPAPAAMRQPAPSGKLLENTA